MAYGELSYQLREDPRVEVFERTNACYLEHLPEPVEFFTCDISLVSLRNVLPNMSTLLSNKSEGVVLFKPQYEISKEELPEGAVIYDAKAHQRLLDDFSVWLEKQSFGLKLLEIEASPIAGSGGNKEFLLHLEGY